MSDADPKADDGPIEMSTKERGGIQSIERAFAILRVVASQRNGVRLAELSRELGLHTSTTFHLVKTMVQLGYLRQMSGDKSYRIGTQLYTLAGGALDDVEMTSLAVPVLERLSAATGEASHFAVREGHDVVVLARTYGTGAFQMTDRVGTVRPAHCTALGKILLSALDERQLASFLSQGPLAALTPRSIVDVDRLREEIATVRGTEVAYDDGELNPEVRCVAVPVRDFTGKIRGAIGISGAVWRLSLQALAEKTAQVRLAAGQLSEEFGYSPERPGATRKTSARGQAKLERRKRGNVDAT